jgi:transketolase
VPKYFRFDGKPLPDLAPAVSSGDLAHGFRTLRPGRLLMLATGYMSHKALAVAARLPEGALGVVDLLSLRPVDAEALAAVLGAAEGVFTLEEGFLGAGGLDALVSQLLRDARMVRPLECYGVDQRYLFDLGGREVLHERIGLSVVQLAERVRSAASRWAAAPSAL